MKKYNILILSVLLVMAVSCAALAQGKLRLVIIRHGEKLAKQDNLSCTGLNRSLKLITVLNKKIGVPEYIYVPSVGNGPSTTHSRMFQTITPFAANYSLSINSSFKSTDYNGIVKDLKHKQGTVLFVWEHESIAGLAKALGIKGSQLNWKDSDFDSIWIITGKGKSRVMTVDKEGIIPGNICGPY